MMIKPTCEELLEMKSVHRESDDSWRHGSYITEVFYRQEDFTLWQASYRLSSDGETNELIEGIAEITQVCTVFETVTKYVEVDDD